MNQSTNEQRDAFLERIKKPGCPSIKTIAEEMGLSKATLYAWVAANKRKQRGISMTKRHSTRSPLNKLQLISQTEGMGLNALTKFCEEKGVSLSELSSWRDIALSSIDTSSNGVISKAEHDSEVAALKGELLRKEKALAEAAALLLLQKKTSEILEKGK